MKQDFFAFLPSEIITNILSRLPIRSIARSKCVCKPWLHLLETDEFIDSHLAKSVPSLAALISNDDKCPSLAALISNDRSSPCSIFEFEEEAVDFDFESCERRFNQLTKFGVPVQRPIMFGAAKGLLLLHSHTHVSDSRYIESLYICNPITREYAIADEYVKLRRFSPDDWAALKKPTYGFGASKITGKLKVVRISTKFKCHVRTLGTTESWRRVATASAPFVCDCLTFGAFVNGNLHWLRSEGITCFDLETECFSTFSAPLMGENPIYEARMCVLKGCLCLCAIPSVTEMAIWSMKEYGVEKSRTKEYSIRMCPNFFGLCSLMFPIEVFRNGDVLMASPLFGICYYSKKSEDAREIRMFRACSYSLLFTPSFLSLQSIGMENVVSF